MEHTSSRATISVVPCPSKREGMFHVTIDGRALLNNIAHDWCGNESEANSKADSLAAESKAGERQAVVELLHAAMDESDDLASELTNLKTLALRLVRAVQNELSKGTIVLCNEGNWILDDVEKAASRLASTPAQAQEFGDGAGQDVPPEKVLEAVNQFSEMWGSAEFDCGPQDYEWMAQESIKAMRKAAALTQPQAPPPVIPETEREVELLENNISEVDGIFSSILESLGDYHSILDAEKKFERADAVHWCIQKIKEVQKPFLVPDALSKPHRFKQTIAEAMYEVHQREHGGDVTECMIGECGEYHRNVAAPVPAAQAVAPEPPQCTSHKCPDCDREIQQPLARQKMYRHLLTHGYNEAAAREIAEKLPATAAVAPPEGREEDSASPTVVRIMLENEYGAALNAVREDYPKLAKVFDEFWAHQPKARSNHQPLLKPTEYCTCISGYFDGSGTCGKCGNKRDTRIR